MQTFVPHPDCATSAKRLDRARLGKQRVECLQILKALQDPNYGWQNHPAVNMWRGHEKFLGWYGICVCEEWLGRGYKDTCKEKILNLVKPSADFQPVWWGKEIHASHRKVLLAKNPDWYSQWGWTEKPSLDYYWPTSQ
jgi:hypothetical protein